MQSPPSPNWRTALLLSVVTLACLGGALPAASVGRLTTPARGGTQSLRLKQDVERFIKRYDLVKLDTARLAEQARRTGRLSLDTLGEGYEIDLVPHDMRSPRYRAEEVGSDGRVRPVERGPVRTYRGTVRGVKDGLARLTLDEGRVEGLISVRGARYFIEPARNISPNAAPGDYVFYNSADVLPESELGCGATLSEVVGSKADSLAGGQALAAGARGTSAVADSTLRVVELATEADYEYVETVGGSAQANEEILSIMNQVDGIYNADVGVGFTVVYQHTWATPDDPYTSPSAFNTLTEFTNYWNANRGSVARDLAHMFTTRPLNDFAGIAWIGVVCNSPSSSYALSLRRTWRQASLVAHEIGHNFGATHINTTSSCELSIMQSGVGFSTSFCQFSRDQINSHIARNSACLSSATTNCTYALSAETQTHGAGAANGSVSLTSGEGCNWLATSNTNWINVNGAGNPDSFTNYVGSGSATLEYTIAENHGYTRKGTISIAGRTFTVTQAGALPDCNVTPLRLGQTVNGTLSTSDCSSLWSFFRTYAQQYSFEGVAGQQVGVTLNSQGYTPYLYLMGPDGAPVSSSNQNGGPNNAHLPAANTLLTLPATGAYTIEVTSLSGTGTGGYTLGTLATPGVITGAASGVSDTGARLNGTASAADSATNVWFEWGTSGSLAAFNSTPQRPIDAGSTNLGVSEPLAGLAVGTVYYYRLAASNGAGTSKGSIHSFTAGVQPPLLLTEENSDRAVALDSVTLVRGPFPVPPGHQFSPDGRARVMLFAVNVELLAGENASAVTAQAEDASRRVFPLTVEHVGRVPGFDWLTQINVSLPGELASAGDVWVSVTLRGAPSNKALVGLRPL